MTNTSIVLALATLFCLAVQLRTSSALAPQCIRNQEFFCQTATQFAWCEDTKYVETCPFNLFCNTDLEYLCEQKLPTTKTPLIETTTQSTGGDEEWNKDNSTFPENQEEIPGPWDVEGEPPSSCTKEGRFSDIHACNSYHICVSDVTGNLTHIAVKCPGNSHYSNELGRCTVPEKARCDSEFSNFICPNSGRVPHPKDCNSFILCYPDGTWRRYFCPLHSYFDPETLKCSFSKTVCQPLLNVFNCSKRGLFSDKFDCRKFYYCIPYQDKLVEGFAFCPKNSVFNPETSRCTINFNVCNKIEKFCTNKRAGRYPNTDDCSKFYICNSKGALSASYTCPYGSHYNAKKSRCVFENQSTCGRSIEQCTQEGRFADIDANCTGFYVCVQRHHSWTKQHYKCPSGSLFNTITQRCSTNTTCFENPNKNLKPKPKISHYNIIV